MTAKAEVLEKGSNILPALQKSWERFGPKEDGDHSRWTREEVEGEGITITSRRVTTGAWEPRFTGGAEIKVWANTPNGYREVKRRLRPGFTERQYRNAVLNAYKELLEKGN